MRLENEKIGDIDSIGVRIPTYLKEKLKATAKQNKQSMNAEIVKRLEKSFEDVSENHGFDPTNDLHLELQKIKDEIIQEIHSYTRY